MTESTGAPTSPVECATCGAEPGTTCVYIGTGITRYALHRARRPATAPGEVTIARLRELAADVRRYRNAPGVLFGTPSTLAEICRLLGFKNRCERGRVYLTPTKIQRLGLPLTDADAPGFAPRKEATPTT